MKRYRVQGVTEWGDSVSIPMPTHRGEAYALASAKSTAKRCVEWEGWADAEIVELDDATGSEKVIDL